MRSRSRSVPALPQWSLPWLMPHWRTVPPASALALHAHAAQASAPGPVPLGGNALHLRGMSGVAAAARALRCAARQYFKLLRASDSVSDNVMSLAAQRVPHRTRTATSAWQWQCMGSGRGRGELVDAPVRCTHVEWTTSPTMLRRRPLSARTLATS